jgi:hypothetical protein
MSEQSPAQFKADRKRKEAAAVYRATNPQQRAHFERMLKWKESDDPRFDAIGSSERISLGYFELARAAAKAEGEI